LGPRKELEEHTCKCAETSHVGEADRTWTLECERQEGWERRREKEWKEVVRRFRVGEGGGREG